MWRVNARDLQPVVLEAEFARLVCANIRRSSCLLLPHIYPLISSVQSMRTNTISCSASSRTPRRKGVNPVYGTTTSMLHRLRGQSARPKYSTSSAPIIPEQTLLNGSLRSMTCTAIMRSSAFRRLRDMAVHTFRCNEPNYMHYTCISLLSVTSPRPKSVRESREWSDEK